MLAIQKSLHHMLAIQKSLHHMLAIEEHCIEVLGKCLYSRFVFGGAKGAPILFSEIGFVWLHVRIYIYIYNYMYISVKMAAPSGSLTLLSFHSLCLHLNSHLTKCEVLKNTSS